MSEQPDPVDYSQTSDSLTDADVRRTMLAAIRLLLVLSVIAAALYWWRMNWQSAVLLLVGSAISSASLWEWLRLMTVINQRMDAGGTPRPMGLTLLGFFTRLSLTLIVLYVSLKYLQGTVFARAAGLGLGLVSLIFEASKLLKRPVS
jgi:hypothetical protein